MIGSPSRFQGIARLIAAQTGVHPEAAALICDGEAVTWRELGARVERIASGLIRAGVSRGDRVALLTALDIHGVVALLATLRAGACAVSLSAMSSQEQLASMIADSGSKILFCSWAYRTLLDGGHEGASPRRVGLDFAGGTWEPVSLMEMPGPVPEVAVTAEDEFSLVYSSGTTSEPSGILQSQGMRLAHVERAARYKYGPDTVTLLCTPLSSNITSVALFASLASGGCVVLMPKFDAGQFLELSERHRVTHTTLVPVQYSRIIAHPDFGRRDLGAYRVKISVGSALALELKREIVARWPGRLYDVYASTEGGVTCILSANEFPDKLHTIGQPAPGCDLWMIDDEGKELPRGAVGEMAGRSSSMMSGYFNNPEKTAAISWRNAEGHLFYRTGDLARYDEDGFVVLVDRKKDMIISGGLNVFPSDIEKAIVAEPGVLEVAVFGVPSAEWGEVPAAAVVVAPGGPHRDALALKEAVNRRLGKAQRIADLRFYEQLPRSPIGKVLKRVLRDMHMG